MVTRNFFEGWCVEKGYDSPLVVGPVPSKIIIFGEKHRNNYEDLQVVAQKETLKLLGSEFLLHQLAGVQTYDPDNGEFGLVGGRRALHGDIVGRGVASYLVRISNECGVKLVGVDWSDAEREDWESREDICAGERQQEKMGELFVKYCGMSLRPVLGVVGHSHLRAGSGIWKPLKESGVGCVLIKQQRD